MRVVAPLPYYWVALDLALISGIDKLPAYAENNRFPSN